MSGRKRDKAKRTKPLTIRLDETVAEQLAELRAQTKETLTDQLNDGAERHIRARRRQLSRD